MSRVAGLSGVEGHLMLQQDLFFIQQWGLLIMTELWAVEDQRLWVEMVGWRRSQRHSQE